MIIFKYLKVYKKVVSIGIFFIFLLFCLKKIYFYISFLNTPTIFVITATYGRYEQLAELNRLKNTFLHIQNLHWILVEDSNVKSKIIQNFLEESGLSYTHLNIQTPNEWKIRGFEPFWIKPKAVIQRNLALSWIRQNFFKINYNGVVYIADDDNSYSIKLFNEMRTTRMVATWPVGLAGELPWEGCVGDGKGGVSKFWVAFKPERPFPIDMAGFAVNLKLILKHQDAIFSYNVPIGYQESFFLQKLNVKLSDLESKAEDCKRILVWHLRTNKPLMREGFKLASNGIKSPPILDEFYSEFSK